MPADKKTTIQFRSNGQKTVMQYKVPLLLDDGGGGLAAVK